MTPRPIYVQGVGKTVDYEICFPICFLILRVCGGKKDILLKHLFMPPKEEQLLELCLLWEKSQFQLRG